MIEVGKAAADFCLASGRGDEVCLVNLRGKWVVLFFYVKDSTSGWTAEALEFSELVPEFQAFGAVVFGVSPDSQVSHAKFTEKHGLKVDLLSDPEHKVLEAYGAWGLKKLYGKESQGVIRSTVVVDPRGVVAAVWPKAKSKGHAIEVLNRLKELTR